MTRTYPPDIIVSTLYQDITISPDCGLTKCSPSTKECDSQMVGTQNQNFETINKRHCRSFDFIESLDDPNTFSSSMECPYTAERQTVNKDGAWNDIGQQGHLRFSSPDLFNTKLSQQQTSTDKTNESVRNSLQGKTRSKSVPKVRATLTPVPIIVSQPSPRWGQSPVYHQKKPEGFSQTREPSLNINRALVNEVHPIKLQPQTPLCVSDSFEENRQDKLANSPHVRYRVDIKPDAAVLEHTTRKLPAARNDMPWQRYSTSSFRSMSVPRQMPTSRTPTPSECYSMDCRPTYHYPNCIPGGYIQPAHISLGGTSLRDSREYRTLSNPNIPTKFFYTEDPTRYPVQPPGRTCFQDDQYSTKSSNNQNPSVSGQYVNDPRSRWVFTMPVRTYYADSRQQPLDAYYNRPYSMSEPRTHFMAAPQTRAYCRESARTYAFPTDHSKIFYSQSCHSPAEYSIPVTAYHAEGRQIPHISQVVPDDWYRSSIATYSSQYPSSQVTPQKTPAMSRWDVNHFTEPSRLGGDVRNYSKSWENILIPHMEKEHTVPRGRSYENLYQQGKERVSPDNRQNPVIINLSSSPRRYAALSLSENSLEKYASDRTGMGCHWFVTPEITITDNDICPGNSRKKNKDSVSWDMTNGRQSQNANNHNLVRPSDPSEPSERKHNNSSLQQSLEQLDELLADLVSDYKPQNGRQSSEGLIDRLKLLINDDEVKGEEVIDQEDSGLLNTQTNSTKTSPDTVKDPDSGCGGFQRSAEDISINQSADEDDSMVCSNSRCRHKETLFNASLYFKSCHSCYTYYCSRNCRREDWDTHKESCLYGRISSICRHILKHCRENSEIHKSFSRIAKVGYLSRGRGILFIGFQNPASANNFLQVGLESIAMSPTYLSLRELESFKDSLREYCKELRDAGKEYDPSECFLLNVSIAIGDLVPNRPSPRLQAATVRKYAKVSLASSSPDKKVLKKENDMETLILTPPPGTSDIDKEGQEGRKAREICFINIQKELRTRGVFLRHEFPQIYSKLCEFVENNKRFTPTTIYPIDKRTGKQFMCMIMAASEPRTLDWIGAPHLLDDII
ncbi:apical junction component 1 homolog [Pygocentrus nattereri]|uniref:Apical junction molecule ajm1 alpha/beta domain-containing protein n=1 Tax=Pygocentrus nattereri TaxID=42514 RepID=A0A3B4EPH1_PYGNA|nr:apical junction component 1 homolog [Pygocentrus nattereri]XP_017564995.1 apical junction component 1 homolog [Pygocentrus nattereri]XP_037391992.1 apical junction component 1 homolog [Pygocentrus nattereri]